MKSIIKRILFLDRKPKNFPAVRIKQEDVLEKVRLSNGKMEIDISKNHCIVCQTPFVMAIWMTADQLDTFNDFRLRILITARGNKVANAKISFVQKIKESDNWIVLFKIYHANCFQLNFVRQFLLFKYFRNKTTTLETKIYGALYSYPRRVISVSYKDNDYYNIFPMDFQCRTDNDIYILGLRTTNVTIDKIIQSKKIVIADTDRASLETIYFLGSHHSKSPKPLAELPFKTIESEKFMFPVPDFASSYNEVEIMEHRQLGSHILLIGKIKHFKELRSGSSSLYHIHFFQLFKSNYLELKSI